MKNELMNNENNDVIMFFAGLLMTVIGGYLFMQNIEVYAASIFSFRMFGRNMDGLIFVPLIASIIFLFYKYNWVSKVCCGLSLAIIVINVIMNIELYWKSTSLFVTLIIFVLLFGGLGLLAKVILANPSGKHGKHY